MSSPKKDSNKKSGNTQIIKPSEPQNPEPQIDFYHSSFHPEFSHTCLQFLRFFLLLLSSIFHLFAMLDTDLDAVIFFLPSYPFHFALISAATTFYLGFFRDQSPGVLRWLAVVSTELALALQSASFCLTWY